MRHKKTHSEEHPDYDYIIKKIGSHGGSFSYNDYNSVARIHNIYAKPRIFIFYYNVILLLRFYYRKYLKK